MDRGPTCRVDGPTDRLQGWENLPASDPRRDEKIECSVQCVLHSPYGLPVAGQHVMWIYPRVVDTSRHNASWQVVDISQMVKIQAAKEKKVL